MEERWDEVYNFLFQGIYPSGLNKSQKLNLRRYSDKFTLDDGELFVGKRRAIKSKKVARKIFEEFHCTPKGCHPGILKTRAAISSRFYWKGMSIDIDNWVVKCDKCQRVGKPLVSSKPLQCFKVSDVWELVGIDLMGPFPETVNRFVYILTATDYFSKWVEAFPVRTKTAQEVGLHICSMIYRHGCPKRILSDQGSEFVNDLNNNLCRMLSLERSVTAEYHPQTNSLDEETNHDIKRALTALVNERPDNWDLFLEATLFSLRSKVHATTKSTPFKLMYGREAVCPSEVPVDVPLSSISLPDDTGYGVVAGGKKRKAMEDVGEKAADNISPSGDCQKQAHARQGLKTDKNTGYHVGDEVLLFNTRKRGRKGGRVQPDSSKPPVPTAMTEKLVSLSNNDGLTLKTVMRA